MSDTFKEAAKYFEAFQNRECRDLHQELKGEELAIQKKQEEEELEQG